MNFVRCCLRREFRADLFAYFCIEKMRCPRLANMFNLIICIHNTIFFFSLPRVDHVYKSAQNATRVCCNNSSAGGTLQVNYKHPSILIVSINHTHSCAYSEGGDQYRDLYRLNDGSETMGYVNHSAIESNVKRI